MPKLGEKVIYGIHGVCMVTETETIVSKGKSRAYFVLRPVNQEGSRFLVPMDHAEAMSRIHPLASAEDWNTLLSSAEVHKSRWIPDEGQRKQAYKELISHGSREELLAMLFTLYDHQDKQRQAGRKCHICDDMFLRDVEKMLVEEIACVFPMQADEAKQFIKNKRKEESAF